MAKTRWRVEAHYPASLAVCKDKDGKTHTFVLDPEIEEVVGRMSDDSGTGCGKRDMGWEFTDMEEAWECYHRLKKAFGSRPEITIDEPVEKLPFGALWS